MIEGFVGKMTNQMLCGMRVQSKEELADRIYKHFGRIWALPHRKAIVLSLHLVMRALYRRSQI